MKDLERENRELKLANEILRTASECLAQIRAHIDRVRSNSNPRKLRVMVCTRANMTCRSDDLRHCQYSCIDSALYGAMICGW